MPESKELLIGDKTYILNRLPAWPAWECFVRLRELKGIEDHKELFKRLLASVAVKTEAGAELNLTTEALINNHVNGAEEMLQLEQEILQYNYGFFPQGEISACLRSAEKVAPAVNIETLTAFLGALSKVGEQASTN